MNGVLGVCVLLYLAGAGWQDLRTRRIPNGWSAGWAMVLMALHLWQGTWVPALTGVAVMGLGALIPTLRGWWGVGDFKMAMVLGIAVGALPAVCLWLVGCVVARWLQPVLRRVSLRWMDATRADTIPLATVMGVVALGLVESGSVIKWVL